MSAADDAKRLMKELVARGHQANVPINNSHLQAIATGIGLEGGEQDAAIQHAGDQGWINHGVRQGTVDFTQAGWDVGSA